MFVTMNSVVMVVIALSIVMIAYGVIINIEAIVHKKGNESQSHVYHYGYPCHQHHRSYL